ncbi:MAG: hypothetical protein IJD36_00400 [Clostridia bacterium]|nr:hypothetical protein [Clostridia bacterium]
MKKIIYILLLIISLSGCAGKYKGWKEIEMADLGTIKIPEGWVCHIQDNEIYFADEGVTEFTEDTVHLAGYIYEEDNPIVAYKMFDKNAVVKELITNEIFSNSTFMGTKKYVFNGKSCEKLYLMLEVIEQNKEIYMIVWDENVSYDDIKKMAISFDRYTSEE